MGSFAPAIVSAGRRLAALLMLTPYPLEHLAGAMGKRVHLASMKAYSIDLRIRVVQAVDKGMTVAEASRTFGVGYNTVRRYLALRDATGSLARKPRPGDSPAIGPELYPALLAQLQAHPDATLEEHAEMWEAQHGVRLHPSTLGRSIARAGWTLKKRSSTHRSGTRQRGPGGAPEPKG